MYKGEKTDKSDSHVIKRADLKPIGSVERYNELLKNDIKEFMFNNKSMNEISCPICFSASQQVWGEKYDFNFVCCDGCGFVFVNPRPSSSDMINYYANSKASAFFQSNIIAPTEENRIELIVKPRLAYIEKKYPSKGKWLDIGCSSAILLAEAKKIGWEVTGLDFEKNAIAAAERRGVQVLEKPIESLGIELEFHLITLFEVLEHLSSPRETLEACYAASTNGGSIVITVPNIEGFEFESLGVSHTNVCPPSHLNYFSPATLSRLLLDVGYEITDIDTPGYLDVDNVRSAILSNTITTTGNKFIDTVLMSNVPLGERNREALQRIISSSGKSGHLRICAKKQ